MSPSASSHLIFVDPDGRRTVVTAKHGESVMRAALTGGVDGIPAECGGSLACGTCRVRVASAVARWLAPPTADELAMLDATGAYTDAAGIPRLSCQLVVDPRFEGMEFHLQPA